MFKLPPRLVQIVFNRLRQSFPTCEALHLLWTLHYLKTTTAEEENIAATLRTNRTTLRLHVQRTVLRLIRALPHFRFDTRFERWPHLRPSCLVDTTFVETTRPFMSPYFYFNSHKNKYGLLYQVTCSFGKPFRILHFAGPFKGGVSDVGIIRSTLIPLLRGGEMIMCDKGYLSEPRCWTAPRGKFQSLT